MDFHVHPKSRLFTLDGRKIVLNEEHCNHCGCKEAVIVQRTGAATFECRLKFPDGRMAGSTIILHRSEFVLPPLPPHEREPEWISDYSEGFDYADDPNFDNPFAKEVN